MVTLICDTCGEERELNSETTIQPDWIQGYDLLTKSERLMQRAIRLLDGWDQRRIAELGAVHFCSIECKDKYLSRNAVA